MKPLTAAIIGGITGLLVGIVFLSDISGAPIFACLVFGFISYEAAWALGTIGNIKTIETRNRKEEKAAKKAALKKQTEDKDALERRDQ